MKTLFATVALLSFAVGVIGIHVFSKKAGRKEAVNILRKQQLEQVDVDLEYHRSKIEISGNTEELKNEAVCALVTWYTAEVEVVNEMYDEILNNL